MTEALRPMSTGELLDRTFSLYKNNFLLFLAIAVPAPALYLLLEVFMATPGWVGDKPVAVPSAFGVGAFYAAASGGVMVLIAYMLGLAISYAATIRAVSAVHLSRPITVREAFAGVKGKFWRIIGIFLLVLIAVGIGFGLLMGAVALMIAGLSPLMMKFGMFFRVVAVILDIGAFVGAMILASVLFARYSLSIQACMVEDTGVMASINRSVVLAKGSIRRILTVYTLFLVINMAIALTTAFAVGLMIEGFHSFRLAEAASALSTFVAGVLTSPLVTVALSLVYYDERVRKEAFDLQLMMATLNGPQTTAATAS